MVIRLLLFILIMMVFLILPLFSQTTEIYSAQKSSHFGQSLSRKDITVFTAKDFLNSAYVKSNGNGFLTALVLSRKNWLMLKVLLEKKSPYNFASLILEQKKHYLLLENKDESVKIAFSAEKAPAQVLSIINQTYKNEEKIRRIVLRHYRENYIIRIYGAEDFNQNGKLDYQEALAAATMLADKSQWLWGIRDGSDYLAPFWGARHIIVKENTKIIEKHSIREIPAKQEEAETGKIIKKEEVKSPGKKNSIKVVPGKIEGSNFKPIEKKEPQ